MVDRRDIGSFAEKVAEAFQPDRIILFGSHAYGTPHRDSDVDLLVVMPHAGHPAEKAAEIRKAVRAGFPLDLIVRSPGELHRCLDMGDSFIREIVGRGVSLYESPHARMD